MFLTRFQLNPRRRGSQKLLSSPQAMHAAVLAGFADPQPTEAGRILWRLDSDEHHRYLYVVSPEQPDLTHLVEQAGWPTTETWLTRPYETVLNRIEQGQTWAFRLRANPTHSIAPAPGEKRGKRYGHVTPEQQVGWLLGKSEAGGFEIPLDAEGEPIGLLTSGIQSVRFSRGESGVTLRVVQFDGILNVVDAESFKQALTTGIGPAKGYGCGLLTIAPVP